MITIKEIQKKSVAKWLRLKDGDKIVSINGHTVDDVLDYAFYESCEDFTMVIERNGKQKVYEFSKDADQPLGIVIGDDAEIQTIQCLNNCMFCFVDQLPKGMRNTLYVKDDDYRLSFVSGNYVTMTNVTDQQIERIIRQRISPLYISVHATNTEVRNRLIGNQAQPIMPILQQLAKNGIIMHTQIVMVPNINDGEVLKKTVEYLYSLSPSIVSCAVVPVGLTCHRQHLPNIAAVDKKQAQDAIEFCHSFNSQIGHNFVWCSDEMYMRAEICMPDYDYYDQFSQIENGVGLCAKFENEFKNAPPPVVKSPKVVVTGMSAYGFMCELLKPYPHVRVIPIQNNFFGNTVTVSGLVTGGDIIKQVNTQAKNAELIIPRCMLKEFETVFLDDITVTQVQDALQCKVKICNVNGADFAEMLNE